MTPDHAPEDHGSAASSSPGNGSARLSARLPAGLMADHPWDPVIARNGDDDEDEIYRAVGFALSEWARFEASLCRLFAAFAAPQDHSLAAARAFGAVAFDAKLAMLRAAASSHFGSMPDEATAAQINKLCCTDWPGWGLRQNELAHGYVQMFASGKFDAEDRSIGEYFLVPPFSELRTPRMPTQSGLPFRYNASRINTIGKVFGMLALLPQQFVVKILAQRWPRPRDAPMAPQS